MSTNTRTRCSCHDIPIDAFRAACRQGAHNVKTCFKAIGCLPKCNNCIPMVRSVLAEQAAAQTVAAHAAASFNASQP